MIGNSVCPPMGAASRYNSSPHAARSQNARTLSSVVEDGAALARLHAPPRSARPVLPVDRVWPRGRTKEALELEQWARDFAPSADLRKWFGHDPKRWEVFQSRYRRELQAEEKQQQMRQLLAEADGRTIIMGSENSDRRELPNLDGTSVLMALPEASF